MHYFQQRYLREVAAFPALAGLLTVDLPNKGLLSGIELRVWGTNGAGADLPDVWLHDRLTRVEVIVNGSQVVKSYDARQLQAMMLYKKTPHYSHDMKNMHSAAAEEFFYINFGRNYHDLDFMLDLGRVNDPELRLTYNFGLATAEGWTNGVAMAVPPSYAVICHLLRDSDVTPRGYIKTAEIARFNNAANLQQNMNVPRGPTYSNLYLQSWWAANGFAAIVDHTEVNINSDDLIPYRIQPVDMIAEVVRMYGLFDMQQQVSLTHAQAYPFPLEVGRIHYGDTGLVGVVPVYADLWGNAIPGFFKDIATGLVPTAGSYNVGMHIMGSLPFSVVPIPLFNPWDEKTWLNTAELGDFWVRVEETAAAAAGVMKLLGDEVVTTY